MQTEFIEYQTNDLTMQGFVARNVSAKPQPVILIVHDWSGCRELMQAHAQRFAELGFVGFAVDLYGKGKRGGDGDNDTNQQLMGEVLEERGVIVKRLNAALECAKKLKNVQENNVFAIGFCFGGLCVLDFARSGVDIVAAISVHGILNQPDDTSSSKIKAKILALHGYKDIMVTPAKLAEFEVEMTNRGADWQLHVFGTAAHAFTNPKANDAKSGLQYDSSADKMSWNIIESYVKTYAF